MTIDLSLAMLRRAREKEAPAVVGRVVADAEALPFRGGTFDWAAETLVFCEVADPVAGYAEVARTVRAGGPLIFLEHVRPSGILGRLADLLTPLTRRLWGEHLNRRAADLVRAAGLTIVREEWLWRDLVTLIVARAGDGEAAARPTHL